MPAICEKESQKLLESVQNLTDSELPGRLRRGLEIIDPRVFELSDAQLDQAFLPDAGVGRWPARVLLGHLADAELVLVHRMRRIVAEDRPVLAVFDEQAFIDGGLYSGTGKAAAPDIGGFLATVHTLRQWAGRWLQGLPAEAWARSAMHPEKGEQTLRDVVEYDTWHLEHHAAYLNAKIERMLGPAPAAPPAPRSTDGGCGPGCACRHD